MKKSLAMVIIILSVSGCAGSFGQGWSRADTYRQLTSTAVSAYDLFVQTPQYIESGGEYNPLLTDTDQLASFFVISNLIEYAISALLKPKKRSSWQWLSIGAKSSTVVWNGVRDDDYANSSKRR